MITSPDHAQTGFTTTCLIESLFFPPRTCHFIANSTESSQQRHDSMPASLTSDQLGPRASRETWPKISFLLKLVLSPHCVSPFLEVRRYLPDTSHASCRRYPLLPAPRGEVRSLAARQGRCQPGFRNGDPTKDHHWVCSWTWTLLNILAPLNSTSSKTWIYIKMIQNV